jgi:pantoate--beta-alanine ligase
VPFTVPELIEPARVAWTAGYPAAMLVFVTPDSMRGWSSDQRRAGLRTAVVPTMGALHDGHLRLIAAARQRADRVIVTIFVNPLQFNQETDFDSYPRPTEDDLAACDRAGVAAVYAPTAEVMYPPGFQTHVDPGDLAERLEGPMRPGHFRGVTTVVSKLFGATVPDIAVFGRKDFQQLAIIRRMVADLDLGIDIVGVPIAREADGLAMSSRNVHLTPSERNAAVVLSKALAACEVAYGRGERRTAALRALVTDAIGAEGRASLEYVAVVDAETLRDVEQIESTVVVLVAAWFGDVRLIDNRELGDD